MARPGLAAAAALIYLHSTSDRQHVLADAVADRVQSELSQVGEVTVWRCGTYVARQTGHL